MNSCFTVQDVRDFINDRTDTNTLISGVRWSDKDIENAFIFTIDFFNLLPPPVTQYTVETWPYRALGILGTAGNLLRGHAVGEASNSLAYSAANVSVNDRSTQMQAFMEIGNRFWEEFKELAKTLKIMQNINGAFGHNHSEYFFRAGY
jgi:hypothetical protein